MPLTLWKQITRVTSSEFACYMIKTDDPAQQLMMEAMLDCRNPDADPEERIYVGWHARFALDEQNLNCEEVFMGTCRDLGEWQTDNLTSEESTQIHTHLQDILNGMSSKLEPLSVKLTAPSSVIN